MASPSQSVYFAHVVPGLESIAQRELQALALDIQIIRVLERFDERTGLILFRMPGSPEALCGLRTVEDLFVCFVDKSDIPVGPQALRQVRAAIASSDARRAATVALGVRRRRSRQISVRTIARASGRHTFRRVDLQRAVDAAIHEMFPHWRQVDDDAVLETWVQVVGSRILIGFRLSSNDLRHRTWRQASIPAALKPTVAAAMVYLSEPKDEDAFLDPMCGSGTIPIERALAGRYRLILCGDSDPAAVEATRLNVGRKYRPIHIHQWDAARLPLGSESVHPIVCNVPFGKQILSPSQIRRLYPQLLAEWDRVLRAPGRMVLLTSEKTALRSAVLARSALRIRRETRIVVRGQPATIFVIDKIR